MRSHQTAPISLGRLLPGASCSLPGDAAGRLISPYVALHRAGFAQVSGHPEPRALLPHDCTLTDQAPLTLPSPPSRGARSMRSYQSAVCFCGSFLGVAPTGSYPAPCPLVSGLSSESLRFSAVARPAPAIILAFPEVHRNRVPGVAQARNAEGHGIGCYLRSKCSCKNATVRSQASCAACALKASGRSFSMNQCPVPGYLQKVVGRLSAFSASSSSFFPSSLIYGS